ncbi:hypothetical protein ACU4GD_11065 [Cupriavidus basilensis]
MSGSANKSDIDEDDLLTFFEQDDNTEIIAQHCEDLKDGRAFAEAAKRVSKKKPVVVLKAGPHQHGRARTPVRTPARWPATTRSMRTCSGQCGVIRARSLRDLLEYARGIPKLPTPEGETRG